VRINLTRITFTTLILLLVYTVSGYSQTYTYNDEIFPRTPGYYGNFYTIFQANSPLIRPDNSKEKVYPFYQYFELNFADPGNHVYFNNYMRGREILGGEDNSFDVYNTFLRYAPNQKYEVRLGRQVITESYNFFILDGGVVKYRPVKGIELITYGGYQYKNIQPEPEEPQDNTSVYGITIKSDRFLNSIIKVGYQLLKPDDFSSVNILNFSFNRVVPFTDYADVYAHGEFDIDEGNINYFTAGFGITPLRTVHLNLAYETYDTDLKPDQYRIYPVLQIFSMSRLHQARVGITYKPVSYVEITSSYAYTHYDVFEDVSSNGNTARLNVLWNLRPQLGLRSYQSIYYIEGREDDRAFGGDFSIYQEIYRGLDVHFTFAYANFKSISNQNGDAYSYISGFQYFLSRNLILRTELEANSNPDFNHDIRVNLGISYNFAGGI